MEECADLSTSASEAHGHGTLKDHAENTSKLLPQEDVGTLGTTFNMQLNSVSRERERKTRLTRVQREPLNRILLAEDGEKANLECRSQAIHLVPRKRCQRGCR